MDLLEAAKNGDEPGARALIAAGKKIDAIREDRCSALGFAASDGDLEAVKLLLALGASVNPKKAEESPLEMALDGEEPVFEEIALLLLERGADPNVNECAALRSALIFGFDRAVEAMLARGADPKVGEPVSAAAYAGSLHWVKRLLELGADPEEGGPIGAAFREGHVEVVAYLLDRKPDFDLGDFFHWDMERAKGPMAELVKKRIQWGEPELRDLLIEAILDNGEELGLFALDGLAGLDGIGRRGFGAIHAAVLAQRIEWLDRLLAKGARPDLALPAAAKFNSLELSAGATPLSLAKQVSKKVAKERGDKAKIAAIEARLAKLPAGAKQPAKKPAKKGAGKLPPRPKGPPWRLAIDDVLVKVAEAGGNDLASLLQQLATIETEGLDAWTYLCKAASRCQADLHSEEVLKKLDGTLLARVLDDRLFDGADWDDAQAKYYPKEARTAIRKGFVLSAWDADLFVLWPTKAGDPDGRMCRAHPESFTVLAASTVELLQLEVAAL